MAEIPEREFWESTPGAFFRRLKAWEFREESRERRQQYREAWATMRVREAVMAASIKKFSVRPRTELRGFLNELTGEEISRIDEDDPLTQEIIDESRERALEAKRKSFQR